VSNNDISRVNRHSDFFNNLIVRRNKYVCYWVFYSFSY